jgi:hypothetical protein
MEKPIVITKSSLSKSVLVPFTKIENTEGEGQGSIFINESIEFAVLARLVVGMSP